MSHQVQAGQVQAGQVSLELDRFEEWFIKRQARQLVEKAGFPVDEVEDIQQEMRIYVLEGLIRRFDKAKSVRHTFVVTVVRYCSSVIQRQRCAAKRNGGRPLQSLNDTLLDAEGNEVELHDMIDRDARRSTDGNREHEERRDLIVDVRRVVASLPDHLREWCAVLGELGIREAARKYHVPVSRVRQIKAEIHAVFADAGLGSYLPQK